MSDHIIVIIWVVRIFLYSSPVYSCHLFLISSVYVRCIPFLSFTEPIFAWNVPLVSLIFLKSSLVFSILLFFSISLQYHWGRLSCLSLLCFGTLHSNGYIFPFLLCLSLLFSQLFVTPPRIDSFDLLSVSRVSSNTTVQSIDSLVVSLLYGPTLKSILN